MHKRPVLEQQEAIGKLGRSPGTVAAGRQQPLPDEQPVGTGAWLAAQDEQPVEAGAIAWLAAHDVQPDETTAGPAE